MRLWRSDSAHLGSTGELPPSVWRPQVSGTPKPLTAAIWNGKQCVVAGFTGAGGVVLTSKDLTTWEITGANIDIAPTAIAWDGKKFVGVGHLGRTMISQDGRNWKIAATRKQSALSSIIWTGAQFLAGGEDGWMIASDDGMSWRSVGFVPINIGEIAFVNGTLIVVNGQLQTSSDGKTWITRKIASDWKAMLYLNSIAWSGREFVAVGRDGIIVVSNNGSEWSKCDFECETTLNRIVWVGGRFVAVGDRGAIISSKNGATWEQEQSDTKEDLRAIVRAGNRLVCVGNSGTILATESGSGV